MALPGANIYLIYLASFVCLNSKRPNLESQSFNFSFQMLAAAGFIGTLVTATPRPPPTPTPSATRPAPAITFKVSLLGCLLFIVLGKVC